MSDTLPGGKDHPVPMVNDEVAVGEDVRFQRRWWSFQRLVLGTFALLIALDAAGVFGHGVLSKADAELPGGTARVTYDRIERVNTPSMFSIAFHDPAIRNGSATVWVSGALVQELGAQRVIPEPATSSIEGHGVRYTFPVASLPARVQLALQPSTAGAFTLQVKVGDGPSKTLHVVVMP